MNTKRKEVNVNHTIYVILHYLNVCKQIDIMVMFFVEYDDFAIQFYVITYEGYRRIVKSTDKIIFQT